jgi:hypothetical protein
MPTYRQFSRVSWGWTLRRHQTNYADTLYIKDIRRLHELVSDRQIPERAPRPGALIQDLRSGEWELLELGRSWSVYFPRLSDNDRQASRYPVPLSAEFWHLYSEPVATFIDAAATLVDAVQEINKLKSTTPPGDGDMVRRRTDSLHILLEATSPGLQLTDKGFKERWISPSLLATLAMMVFQDLTGGRRVLKCGTCNSYFFSSAYQARYCSERCRQTGQKRQWRRSQHPVRVQE